MSTNPSHNLTLQQKVALGSGADFWSTKAIAALPSMVLTDGPHGVRRQTGATDHLGLAGSEPATCFPPAVGLGQSWDRDLVREVGEALGREARSLGVDVLLGPGINIKRDPRCGRNFEYFAEDPLLTAILSSAWVDGIQGTGVGASLKHFAVNNAEHDRMRASSDVDERTLHEIYLRAFEHVIRTAAPWTVMCSYNRINGTYAAENYWLLTSVLREAWGFDGVVVSDWGAVRDRVAAVSAGLDLQMPGGNDESDEAVLAAVQAGSLRMAAIDRSAGAMVGLADKVRHGRSTPVTAPDLQAHHALARNVAGRCVVLLKNDGGLLPLSGDQSIAVIGEFAIHPRYQGGGSSHVNPTAVDSPLDEIQALASPNGDVTFARGFTASENDDGSLRPAAVDAAGAADVAVVFLGLAAAQESEGFDREDIELSADQIGLLAEIVQQQPNTVVVLAHGGIVRLTQVAQLAPAILDSALLGQAAGGGVADVLFGKVNPSGRLSETVPIRLQDTPAYLNFPGENSHTLYGEGQFVGYRWYDTRELDVAFPFGHGLSYTRFRYSDFTVEVTDTGVTAAVSINNVGDRPGREVVQVYTTKVKSAVTRPVRELKQFLAVHLNPGEEERVRLPIERSALAYWDIRTHRWLVEDGEYEFTVGASSRDLRAAQTVTVTGDQLHIPITMHTTFDELKTHPHAAPLLDYLAAHAPGGMRADGDGEAAGIDMSQMMRSIPIGRMAAFGMSAAELDGMRRIIREINRQTRAG
ncbi:MULTISPECIES: glycoside hydrolase family 3 C-terminal domain-containing protein [Actinomycetes]|uniref:glycoside hydrolase family 3 C-terminal domain-containing protein n=1 Tax=Actinomycetes TaxID=1760 RepID=UPI0004BE5B3D|nr:MULTISPECIES: glycoside hydrolase family 3 C-terminal domain-containing protein [Actinomycetes]